MIPSSSNGDNSIFFSYQQAYNKPFFSDIISNSIEDDFPSSFFHWPEDLELEDYGLHDLLLQPLQATDPTISETIDSMVGSSKSVDAGELSKKSHHSSALNPRKRSSKRDRHSKINTRQGPRDRRMRLSLKVAREFFDLQDKLNFDKPSKTVEWLLVQARAEIKKLPTSLLNYSCSTVVTKSVSSTSECEVVSAIDETAITRSNNTQGKQSPRIINRVKKAKPSRKTGFHFIPKELRDKARERARERTKMKNRISMNESKLHDDHHEATNRESSQLSCLMNPFETGKESVTQSHLMNTDMLVEVEVPRSSQEHNTFRTTTEGINMIDESLLIMSKWSSSPFFSLLQNKGISEESQFTDFQPLCKSWEPYNIQSLF
ncbi:hypothetical protein K2173_027358 [Erythroxylum novogranatense]|uniref:Uncharacterized protein n=1 Tax=Erythroxylum novogranatense TaxID=1862640 RepID=A0AAV8TYV4_9ROSI|nr:hypothetical protein K2173_027358 [Erythroxylum novogranatense]